MDQFSAGRRKLCSFRVYTYSIQKSKSSTIKKDVNSKVTMYVFENNSTTEKNIKLIVCIIEKFDQGTLHINYEKGSLVFKLEA